MSTERPIAVGAFCFAGGFTLGVQQHFDVIAHLEERFQESGSKRRRAYAVETQRLNFPHVPTYPGNDWWPLADLSRQRVDFIYGNPPCALFSSMGHKQGKGAERWRDDPRVKCIERHFSLVTRLRPKAWALESVTQ